MKYSTISVENCGIKMSVTNLGGIITHLYTPDNKGKLGDIVLGFDKPEQYLKSGCYFGCIAGRVANRIAKGKFSLKGKKYSLFVNNGENSLHGGKIGFDKKPWDMEECSGDDWKGVCLHYLSKDGEEGYPGNLDVTVFYKLTDNKELVLEYSARADKSTICNLTQHTYFNLSAGKSKDVYDHSMKINSDFYTPVDDGLIPTGEIRSVKGTALDLRKFKKLGKGILSKCPLIDSVGGGYDHNFVLKSRDKKLTLAAVVTEPLSGRKMTVETTEVGMQFYSANYVDKVKGKGGVIYDKHSGFCLETQHFPDSINHPHFPSIVVEPSKAYTSKTVYRFE